MGPNEARTLLLLQHKQLRELCGTAQDVAKRFLAGHATDRELDAAVDALELAFAEHNICETHWLEPLLLAAEHLGPRRVARMVKEHVDEATVFRAAFAAPRATLAQSLDDLAEELDAHMLAEERTFLSAAVLRDGASPPNLNR